MRLSRRCRPATAPLVMFLSLGLVDCSQKPITVPLRSLEASGRMSLLCLGGDPTEGAIAPPVGAPAAGGGPAQPSTPLPPSTPRPMSDCRPAVTDPADFSIPHVYALVTQTTRGEVAIVDLTGQSVVDTDPFTPGFDSLPVGENPVDIDSTPGGTASFVVTAELNYPAVYAIPSIYFRNAAPPTLLDWPSCRLPATPGAIKVLKGVPNAGGGACAPPTGGGGGAAGSGGAGGAQSGAAGDAGASGAAGESAGGSTDGGSAGGPAEGAAGNAAGATGAGASAGEGAGVSSSGAGGQPAGGATGGTGGVAAINVPGGGNTTVSLSGEADPVQKLMITLPSTHQIVVLDAQTVLNQRAGRRDQDCPIERTIDLAVEVPMTTELEPMPGGPVCPTEGAPAVTDLACQVRGPQLVTYPTSFTSQPTSVSVSGQRAYVGDVGAPVVHVLDISDPCSTSELPPLLPTSFDEPTRPVVTDVVAASPTTTDGKQYVYAVDYERGSVMVFDVTPGATGRTPIVQERPDFFPTTPRDRLALNAPVRDITFALRDPAILNSGAVLQDPQTGVIRTGVLCDPDDAPPRTAAMFPGIGFETLPDFTAGASPRNLRGIFAFLTLTSGQIDVVDVDDFDRPCRFPAPRPASAEPGSVATPLPEWVTGCETCAIGAPDFSHFTGASGESTCRAVVRHELRSDFWVEDNGLTGPHTPEFSGYPQLSLEGSTIRSDQSSEGQTHPKLLGPKIVDPSAPASDRTQFLYNRGGSALPVDYDPARAENNYIVPDLREPRVHVDQDWALTFQGPLPGFGGRVAKTTPTGAGAGRRTFVDQSAAFCDRGVHGRSAARLAGAQLGVPRGGSALDDFAVDHADIVEITNDFLDENDPYWSEVTATCNFARCSAVFGTPEAPTDERRFRIIEAYQNEVITEERPLAEASSLAANEQIKACLAANPKTAAGSVKLSDVPAAPVDCCFPTLVTYAVRGGKTWVATGSSSGFLHHVIVADKASSDGRVKAGECVDAGVDTTTGEVCDSTYVTKTGRAYEVAWHAEGPDTTCVKLPPPSYRQTISNPVDQTSPFLFHSPQFFFAVYEGGSPSQTDMAFTWSMIGGFQPLSLPLGQGTVLVAPRAVVFSAALGELIISDGSLQGVEVVDLTNLGAIAAYY